MISLEGDGDDEEFYVIRSAPIDEGGILFESWESFKFYIKEMYSDVLFRHLFCDRNEEFQYSL